MDRYPGFYVRANGPGFREVSCGPSLSEVWHTGSVKEEPLVRSSAAPSVVMCAPGSNGTPVVNAGRSPVLNHSASVEVNSVQVCLPSVDNASRHVSVGRVDWEYLEEWFRDTLVQS